MAKTERRVATEERRMISFDVTREEERMITEAAKRSKMSRAAWVRSACYAEAILSGDLVAVRLLGGRLKGRLVDAMRAHGLIREQAEGRMEERG